MPIHSLTNVPEQTHEAMRAAAQRPVNGPPATPAAAASGGMELPGREQCDGDVPIVGIDRSSPHEPIPGERDAETLTHREAGAVSGASNGSDNLTDGGDALDEKTRLERVREGGGRDAVRHFREQHHARR